AVAERLGVPKGAGVLVGEVFEKTPAARAGLKEGDVITALGGKEVKDGRGLQTTVAGLPLGKPVEVTGFRDGQTKQLPVTIEEQPDEFGTARAPAQKCPNQEQEALGVAKVGVEVTDLTDEAAQELGYKGNVKGALISRVEQGSVASAAGLRRGML